MCDLAIQKHILLKIHHIFQYGVCMYVWWIHGRGFGTGHKNNIKATIVRHIVVAFWKIVVENTMSASCCVPFCMVRGYWKNSGKKFQNAATTCITSLVFVSHPNSSAILEYGVYSVWHWFNPFKIPKSDPHHISPYNTLSKIGSIASHCSGKWFLIKNWRQWWKKGATIIELSNRPFFTMPFNYYVKIHFFLTTSLK